MIVYRKPLDSEISALADLGRDTFVDTFGHLYTSEDLSAFLGHAYSLASVTADFLNPDICYFIAEEDGALIGYCKIGLAPHFADYDVAGKSVVELKQLYIRSGHQGGGIAPVLMDWALNEASARNADEMVLSVWSQNERAQRFYRRYGFDWIANTFFMVGTHRDDEFLFMKPMPKS
jgi:diamine N-acetyltransferase